MTSVHLIVFGDPQPAGSKKAYNIPGQQYPVIVDANPKARGWKDAIAKTCAVNYGGPLLGGPLTMVVDFYQPRPKGHFGSGRNAGQVREGAPAHPSIKPDIDKLSRAVLDGLTGQLYRDDAQIVRKVATKHYGEPARVEIQVEQIEITVGDQARSTQLSIA